VDEKKVINKINVYGKRFKTEIKNRKLENALEMSRFNPKYHEEAKKFAISTRPHNYKNIF